MAGAIPPAAGSGIPDVTASVLARFGQVAIGFVRHRLAPGIW